LILGLNSYENKQRLDWGEYGIKGITLNGSVPRLKLKEDLKMVLDGAEIAKMSGNEMNEIKVLLG
jgi:hypothetical protein